MEDEELHPVRFSKSQINFILHMIHEKALEYWEEECQDILSTVEKSEAQLKTIK